MIIAVTLVIWSSVITKHKSSLLTLKGKVAHIQVFVNVVNVDVKFT